MVCFDKKCVNSAIYHLIITLTFYDYPTTVLLLGLRLIYQHNFQFRNNRMLKVPRKNNTGIIGEIEVMQHYIKPIFAKIHNIIQNSLTKHKFENNW